MCCLPLHKRHYEQEYAAADGLYIIAVSILKGRTIMDKKFVYEPRVLRVNLTTGMITKEKKDAQWARKYVGGMGFGTRILWEELPPETIKIYRKRTSSITG